MLILGDLVIGSARKWIWSENISPVVLVPYIFHALRPTPIEHYLLLSTPRARTRRITLPLPGGINKGIHPFNPFISLYNFLSHCTHHLLTSDSSSLLCL